MIATGWVSPPTAKDLASKVITWRARLEQATAPRALLAKRNIAAKDQ